MKNIGVRQLIKYGKRYKTDRVGGNVPDEEVLHGRRALAGLQKQTIPRHEHGRGGDHGEMHRVVPRRDHQHDPFGLALHLTGLFLACRPSSTRRWSLPSHSLLEGENALWGSTVVMMCITS